MPNLALKRLGVEIDNFGVETDGLALNRLFGVSRGASWRWFQCQNFTTFFLALAFNAKLDFGVEAAIRPDHRHGFLRDSFATHFFSSSSGTCTCFCALGLDVDFGL